MKIAQVAPLIESVPPQGYGGTERIVSYLTEELVSMGHEVTLYASADSVTAAQLRAPSGRSLRSNPQEGDPLIRHLLLLEQVAHDAQEFDVIHQHVDYLHFPSSRRHATPTLTTLHGRLDLPDLDRMIGAFPDMPLVSISDAQRAPLHDVRWEGTVYHGLPDGLYAFQERPGDYLAFLGRISPEKGTDTAIEIARRAGLLLRIAAKVDKADTEYFELRIRPLLCEPDVEYLGEISDGDKNAFLGGARALLFPVDWPEPFGMVMIEAMACGTPVIAFDRGAVREIMEEGVTGFVVTDVAAAVAAVERVDTLDRRACRAVFERRFLARRMAADYVALYTRLCCARGGATSPRTAAGGLT